MAWPCEDKHDSDKKATSEIIEDVLKQLNPYNFN